MPSPSTRRATLASSLADLNSYVSATCNHPDCVAASTAADHIPHAGDGRDFDIDLTDEHLGIRS
ncbi:hypothetical protein EOG37_01335 [Clavibacter michiganensis subsp. michiganensis]|uniref:hypothetical protein n=1 Tax=Clavibacter michiganensis TaxID=28447 RepID=UPI001C647707|nr:hypothetical protein [Clavibacter michiganensis]MBW8025323.1 hypothetical protein [Clavibacter michiganensis subsp. michiganensis]